MNWGPLREYEIFDDENILSEEDHQTVEDEYEEIIIGKEGEYTVQSDGTILIVKKPKGKKSNDSGSSGKGKGSGGEDDEDEEGEGGEGGEGEGKGEGKGKSKENDESKGDEQDDDREDDYSPIPDGEGTNQIDKHSKKVEDKIAGGRDLTTDEADKEMKEKEVQRNFKAGGGGRGEYSKNDQAIDYNKKAATYKWERLIKMFIGTPKESSEQSYAKLGRGSITGIYTASQIGAGAPKPGDIIGDAKQMELAFVVDSSGSMMSIVAAIFANIVSLLGQPKFKKSIFTLFKFSSNYEIWKGNFTQDKAGRIASEDILKKTTSYPDSMKRVFTDHDMNSTNFSSALANDIAKLVKARYNVIIFTDSDCSHGANGDELAKLIKSTPTKVFVIFNNKGTWAQFRTNYNFTTDNISYLGESMDPDDN
jgi:hypothetical protein